jgi:curved DNA-binding protein CbpA
MDLKTIASRSDFESFTRSSNLYVVLGIESNASGDELKTAYRRLALLFHPDRHQDGERRRAEEVFKRINTAYKTLVDPVERRRYDALLRRGAETQIKPQATAQEIDPLAQILEDILKYEHIFAQKDILWLKKELRQMVEENFIADLKERVVGAIRMDNVPVGYKHEGSFRGGSLVITNLRFLFPFWTQWQMVRGNVTTTYTQHYLRGVFLPELRQVSITTMGRIRGKNLIELHCKDEKIIVTPSERNLGKLLLLCSLWGIPVFTQEVFDRSKEIRSAILKVPKALGAVLAGVNALVFLCGACSPDSTAAESLILFNSVGLPVVLIVSATGAGIGIFRSLRAYGRVQVEDLLNQEGRA